MNPVAVAFAVLGLATGAAAGVLAGYLREAPQRLEPLADPLEDRRSALLRSLADLDEARGSGALEEVEHVRLREETLARIARVDAAIERRRARTVEPLPELEPRGALEASGGPGGPRSERAGVRGRSRAEAERSPRERAGASGSPPGAGAEPRRVPAWAVGVLVTGTVLAVVVGSLVRDAELRGEAAASPAAGNPLAFFERRVEQHPDDLAARLDLAHRYLDAGMIPESLEQYRAALELDPDDAEANAHVGMILYLAERPQAALEAVDRALATDPDYPEALFFRGVILLEGLDRPRDAIEALEQYLAAAPFGAERDRVRDLIAEAETALDHA